MHISRNDVPPEADHQWTSAEHWVGDRQIIAFPRAMASALGTNCTLHRQYIGRCSIGPEGAGHLAGALCENSSLEKLYMYDSHWSRRSYCSS